MEKFFNSAQFLIAAGIITIMLIIAQWFTSIVLLWLFFFVIKYAAKLSWDKMIMKLVTYVISVLILGLLISSLG